MQKARTKYLSLAAALLAALALASSPASAAELYTNDAPITIPSSGKASPYPSTINVAGQRSRITDVGVTLRGLTHSDVGDIDVLLVSPDGGASLVMSDTCAGGKATNANLFFNQAFPESVPSSGDCISGVYRPTNSATGDSFPSAPPGPYAADLDAFVGANPNGDWNLYVVDDAGGDSGKFNGGWSLTIESADPDTALPATGLANPYPTTRTVSGMNGVITDVNVALGGVYLDRPQDLDLLLQGPGGQAVMLMSDNCGRSPLKNAVLRWDDAASDVPVVSGCPGTNTYKPTNGFPFEVMPAPAPLSPYSPTLSTFDKTDPNGEWKLYANDDEGPDADGFFTGRFTLDIQTRPKAKVGFAATGVVDVTEGDFAELRLERPADGRALGLGSVKLTSAPLTATSGADFTPVSTTVAFGPGTTTTSISVQALTDALAEEPELLEVTIAPGAGDAEPGATTRVLVRIHDPAPPADDTPIGGGDTPTRTGDPETGPGPDTTGGGPVADRTAPVIGKLKLSRGSFTARRGTTIRYSLSEPATATLEFQRRKGRRYVTAGTLRRAGRLGTNKVAFAGRLGRKALKRGEYRVLVTAVDAAGNRSVPRPRSFRVVG